VLKNLIVIGGFRELVIGKLWNWELGIGVILVN
jgi:hypothetical protein